MGRGVLRALRWGLAAIAAVSLTACGTKPASSAVKNEAKPMDEYIRILGRCTSYGGSMAVDDSCSGLEFRFSGTGASVTLQDVRISSHASRFGIWVDGVRTDTIQLEETERQYTLAENLPQGPHTIRLVKLTEPRFTLSNFKGLAVEGELLPRPEERARKLEFIGDSLTAGFGNLGSDPNEDYTADTQDGTQTYAAFAAEKLGADYTIRAVSGWGVAQDCDGNLSHTLPEIYEMASSFRDTELWDFTRFQPDAVVVNLGTNDFSSGVTVERLRESVSGFTRQIREKNPQAVIVWCYGLATHNRLEDMRQAVSQAAAATADVYFVEIPEMDVAQDGVGNLHHPSVKAHQRAGDFLAEELNRILRLARKPGW